MRTLSLRLFALAACLSKTPAETPPIEVEIYLGARYFVGFQKALIASENTASFIAM